MSMTTYTAELIPFPKRRIVRTRAQQRKLQPVIDRYVKEVRVSAFVAFSVAREKLEGRRSRTEDLA